MANRVEFVRNAAGFKRAQLAEAMGVTERTVYRWERDEVQIPDERKLELARLLHTSVSFLMGWDEPWDSDGNDNGLHEVA